MPRPISPTAARAVLATLQEIADDSAKLSKDIDDSLFARIVLARFQGSIEARLPRAEWDRVDIFRAKRAP